jgi:hypothetical protein
MSFLFAILAIDILEELLENSPGANLTPLVEGKTSTKDVTLMRQFTTSLHLYPR